ncbi:glutaredoxin family protein [Oceanospirillum sediminis]|uniref:Glutaredoxin family protein n=1 Tax=Oceanospirillum sediminis TaxID=2760088 RepID=A0A839IJ06_9GAMM|nr:glutaredoxin family protein [Oceanospirillum sediminis]MBB1485323.1 glutaredoxin family protein [Oceanospirillum sediminis]
MNKTLYLYTTAGCHLCDMAMAIVHPLVQQQGIKLELVEISEQESLVEKYGVRIPVIRLDGQESDLGWPFEAEQAQAYLLSDQ